MRPVRGSYFDCREQWESCEKAFRVQPKRRALEDENSVVGQLSMNPAEEPQLGGIRAPAKRMHANNGIYRAERPGVNSDGIEDVPPHSRSRLDCTPARFFNGSRGNIYSGYVEPSLR